MPGHQFAYSLDEELKEEMERVSKNFNWKSPEQPLDRFNNDMRLLDDILATLDAWVRSRPAPKRTLRQIVLERLEEAGPKGSKAAAIRGYAKDELQHQLLRRGAAGDARLYQLLDEQEALRHAHDLTVDL